MKIEWNKKYTTISAYVLIVASIGMLIYFFFANFSYFRSLIETFFNVLNPFVIGLIFAYVFNPIMTYIENVILPFITRNKFTRRAYRSISIFFTIILGIAVIAVLFSFIIPELLKSVNGLISQITAYIPNLERTIDNILSTLHINNSFDPLISNVSNAVEQFFNQTFDFISKSLGSVINATINITSTIVDIFVGIIIAIYLWSSKELFFAQTKKLSYAFLPDLLVDKLIALFHEANKIFGKFISGKIIDSAIIGVLCYIGMLILNIPFALLISVIIGVTNVIPYFGPFIGAIPSVLLLLMVDPIKAIWFAIFILVLQQIDGNIIGPKILGDSTGLSGFWVIFSVTVFGGIFGFTGMLIGVPLFAVIYTVIKRSVNNRLNAKELSANTASYASDSNPLIKKGEHTVVKKVVKNGSEEKNA